MSVLASWPNYVSGRDRIGRAPPVVSSATFRQDLLSLNSANRGSFGKSSDKSGKKKRAFQRLMSGLTRSRYRGDRLRFMTLTSAVDSDRSLLSRHFQLLRRRIERYFHKRLEYWKINTNEGNGVMHIVFKGGFIPQSWLSSAWKSIHGAKIVDIRALKNASSKNLANYLVGNYLCKQSFERMSWSWGWVYRGFCSTWRRIYSSWYRHDPLACLKAWDLHVSIYSVPLSVRYGSLSGG